MLDNLQMWDLASLVFALAALSASIYSLFLLKRLSRFQKSFFESGRTIPRLEEFLSGLADKSAKLSSDLKKLLSLQKVLAEQQRQAVSRVGVARFNSYAEAGGKNSFSVALLSEEEDGVVITSLFGRDSQRVYLKAVSAGTSEIPLTEEEKQAILESRSSQISAPEK